LLLRVCRSCDASPFGISPVGAEVDSTLDARAERRHSITPTMERRKHAAYGEVIACAAGDSDGDCRARGGRQRINDRINESTWRCCLNSLIRSTIRFFINPLRVTTTEN
jgi:hypothetical protein